MLEAELRVKVVNVSAPRLAVGDLLLTQRLPLRLAYARINIAERISESSR